MIDMLIMDKTIEIYAVKAMQMEQGEVNWVLAGL
jgi:hypothetical protein